MDDFGVGELDALRATIRERGTIRVVIFIVSVAAWAGTTLAAMAIGSPPMAFLVSLLLLAAGFEAVHALHVGVERVGRYIQLVHEREHHPGWEAAVMAYGRRYPGGPDPLFGRIFMLAVAINFLPVALTGFALGVVLAGLLHLALPTRILLARRAAGRQRQQDLERLREIVASTLAPGTVCTSPRESEPPAAGEPG